MQFPFFQFRRSSSASSSADSTSRAELPWQGTKASSTEQTSFGQPSPVAGSLTSSGLTTSLATLPATKALVAKTLLDKLFTEKWFSICEVDSLCDLAGRPRNTPAYKMLRALHCVHYANMPQELLEQIPQLVNECLRAPPTCLASVVALDGVVFDHE
jgi:hypothetical protein